MMSSSTTSAAFSEFFRSFVSLLDCHYSHFCCPDSQDIVNSVAYHNYFLIPAFKFKHNFLFYIKGSAKAKTLSTGIFINSASCASADILSPDAIICNHFHGLEYLDCLQVLAEYLPSLLST